MVQRRLVLHIFVKIIGGSLLHLAKRWEGMLVCRVPAGAFLDKSVAEENKLRPLKPDTPT